MNDNLDKFHVEHGIHGSRLMARSYQLTPGCIAEGEIDASIQALKDNLDACASEMKQRAEKERDSLFKTADA